MVKKKKNQFYRPKCENCGSKKTNAENWIDDYSFERVKIICRNCGWEKIEH